MKRYAMLMIWMLSCCAMAQCYWSIGGAASASLNGEGLAINGVLSVEDEICDGLTLGGELEAREGMADIHGIIGLVSELTEKDAITLRAGIGLGHHFTEEQVDHNFHTYHFGVRYSRRILDQMALNVEPYLWARDWQGNLVKKGEFRISVGATFYIGKKHKQNER